MKDMFEEFIKQHRDEFDTLEPKPRVWDKISDRIGSKTQRSWWGSVIVWRAAAAVFFAMSMYLLFTGKPAERQERAKLQVELRDIESFYGSQIAEKVALIDKFEEGYEDEEFSQDLRKLDAMYEVLREEMKTSPSAKVKDALILNMLVRIDLLNEQIQKLEDNKKADRSKEI